MDEVDTASAVEAEEVSTVVGAALTSPLAPTVTVLKVVTTALASFWWWWCLWKPEGAARAEAKRVETIKALIIAKGKTIVG